MCSRSYSRIITCGNGIAPSAQNRISNAPLRPVAASTEMPPGINRDVICENTAAPPASLVLLGFIIIPPVRYFCEYGFLDYRIFLQ